MHLKFGRKPRRFDPRVPHFSALRMKLGLTQAVAPPSIDYTTGLPDNLGMMLNDTLGDCAEAGFFHFLQVLTQNAAQQLLTEPDTTVQQLYSDAAGYVPGDASTDQGTDLQSLLTYLLNTGALMPDGSRHKILAFFEVDPRNSADINLVTAECGAVYLGFNVPAYLENLEAPGSIWDVNPAADNSSDGGHCVISAKYLAATSLGNTRGIISWGSDDYTMTPPFWSANVDEAYAIIDPLFIEATGKTPFGLTAEDWQAQMSALTEAA